VVQDLENRRALSQTSLVVCTAHRDPCDKMIKSCGLRAIEFGVSKVDVMDDLGR
jgi:hypothetical protein